MRGVVKGWGPAAVGVWALVLTSLAIGGTPAGAASVVECGQLVTTDIVLDTDLGPCPGHGLEILSRTGLTIDLNGHRIIGTGDLDNGSSGIRVFNARRITIKNGTVTRFARGIEFRSAHDSLITGMTLTENTGALFPDVGRPIHAGEGVLLNTSHDNVIRANRVIHNGPSGGITLVTAGGNLIESNLVQGNDIRQLSSGHATEVTQVDAGIKIQGEDFVPREGTRTDENVVRNNQVLGNGWHGIMVTLFTSRNIVVGNQVVGNGLDQPANLRTATYGDGINISAFANNTVEANTVTRNGGNGIAVTQPGTVVRRNTSVFNAQRPNQLANFDLYDLRFVCTQNTWSQNVFRTFNQPCVTG